jgi:molecular chaperone GrpE
MTGSHTNPASRSARSDAGNQNAEPAAGAAGQPAPGGARQSAPGGARQSAPGGARQSAPGTAGRPATAGTAQQAPDQTGDRTATGISRPPSDTPGTPTAAAPEQSVDQSLDQSLAEMRDRWQRAVAELENVRRRFERQLAEQRGAERARVAAEWLPVLDNLELALSHAAADPQAIVAGVVAVWEQARDVMARLGFTPVEDVGRPFDPARHEAVQVVQDPDAKPGTVVAVLRPGYASGDALLRPAAVAVAGERM